MNIRRTTRVISREGKSLRKGTTRTVNFAKIAQITRISKIHDSRNFGQIRSSCSALLETFAVFANFIEESNPGHFSWS